MKAYERLIKYVQIFTTSDENSDTCPSTIEQRRFAEILLEDMRNIGIEDSNISEDGYIYGTIPATEGHENDEIIGLIAHMDTAPSYNGKNIHPKLTNGYEGQDIILNKEKNIILSPKDYPELLNYIGRTIITSDGTTLLGADDKAGVSEILTAAEIIISGSYSHGCIRIAFTPDEEIGRGADRFNVQEFGADYAYTIDGGALGELEYENFNAASATITINGNCIHPGEGKGKMKNAVLIAMEYNSLLPKKETPAYTEGYEGFYHVTDIQGTEESAVLHYIIRDHDETVFNRRKQLINDAQFIINQKYGENTCIIEVKDSYYNMKEMILPHMEIVERAKTAMRENEVEPKIVPIRGGTDGARLSYMGLPCPNLSTGGHNFHGKYEYIPAESMEKMTAVLISLVTK